MRLRRSLLAHLACLSCLFVACQCSLFLPQRVTVGSAPDIEVQNCGTKCGNIELKGINQIATLDFGAEVAGYPYFNISSLSAPVQIEVKYAEQFHALGFNFSDGPYTYVNQLSNTFRVETFNVTKPGVIQSYFVQGGQRWKTVRLLTPGSVTFSTIAFEATIATSQVERLPGNFACSNEIYNDLWTLGARAVLAACLENGTQPATFEVTPDGTLIRGQKPGYSALGASFEDYTLTFYSKIVRGGTGWSVAGNTQLLLVGELPPATTFVNTNFTLTPRNSILLAKGWSFVNQTTLPTYYLDTFKIPFDVHEDEWYKIETAQSNGSFVAVSINDVQIFNISLADYYLGPQTPGLVVSYTAGSFGFGPWQDQVALVRNVSATITANDTQLYRNAMTDPSVPAEYGVATLDGSVCLDGAKRDREVWLGDFFHTSRIVGVSTGRNDLTSGTLQFLLNRQLANGPLPINPSMGLPVEYISLAAGSGLALFDYQILGLIAFYTYILDTGDLAFAERNWQKWKLQIEYLFSTINNSTGLVTGESPYFGFIGPANGTAVSSCMVQGLRGAATIASLLNDEEANVKYDDMASKIAKGINTHLWNEELGVYGLSTDSMGNFSVAGISFAITSGVASSSRAASSLAKLKDLKLYPGFKDDTNANSSDPTVNISPNTNGFLLLALMMTNTTAPAKYLLDTLWNAMRSNNSLSSGASWEYVGQNLTPGLSLFTSLSHPWGGAATYILTNWIAGIRPVTAGYKTFIVNPVIDGFGLTHAQARVPTKYGPLSSHWKVSGDVISITVDAPVGTSGTIEYGSRHLAVIGGRPMTATFSQ
jgi:hypothetical protein